MPLLLSSLPSTPAARANDTDVTLDAPLERIPYHVRGGRIIGTAEPRSTTRDTKAGALTLLVALPGEGSGAERSAHGVVYNDDGESVVQASRGGVGGGR